MRTPRAVHNRDLPLDQRCRLALIDGMEEAWRDGVGRPSTAVEFDSMVTRWRVQNLLGIVEREPDRRPVEW